MKTSSMYKAERMSLDRLPDSVLETILCRLSTKEAARTSILSREWRYKWTKIPNLLFKLRDRTTELTSDIANAMKYMDAYVIYRVLLLRQGPIHDLTILMTNYWEHYDCFEFELIMLHLSRKHAVKELRLDGFDDAEDVCSLETLELSNVKISAQTLLLLLSNCPSLKKLNLHIDESGDTCTINELLKCLPVIENLTVSGRVSEWLVLESVPKERPTPLIYLKSLVLTQFCLVGNYGSAFLLSLIKCSPNLERMHLEMEHDLDFSAVKDEYSDVWLEHLKDLFVCFGTNKLETEFVKFIFARSPKLEKVTILTVVDRKQESKMLKTLLRAPCASRTITIIPWRL